mmetsp:Transcript_7875/g.29170  ORF Transcript_7875/g.29170 Transcript_7875/m.29170 type:complete len:737 (+) Transcript_7875:223-2433(+)
MRVDQRQRLRACWEFAASLHFLQVFSPQLGIRLITAAELEDWLLAPREHSEDLTTIFRALLVPKEDTPATRKHFKESEWEVLLYEAFASARSLDLFEYNPMQGIVVYDMEPTAICCAIYQLVEWRLHDAEDLQNYAREVGGARMEVIGYDASGTSYYHFQLEEDDTRIYSCRKPPASKGKKKKDQHHEPSRPEGSWQTISGLKELKALAKRFSKATNRQEKALYAYLKEEVLPPLEEAEAARILKRKREEQERKRKAELDALPRKRSARVAEAQALRESMLEEERQRREREMIEAVERENRDRVEAEKARMERAEKKALRLAMLDMLAAQDNLRKIREIREEEGLDRGEGFTPPVPFERRLAVYWKDDKAWYPGYALDAGVFGNKTKVHIRYEDGMEEWIELGLEIFCWLGPNGELPSQSPEDIFDKYEEELKKAEEEDRLAREEAQKKAQEEAARMAELERVKAEEESREAARAAAEKAARAAAREEKRRVATEQKLAEAIARGDVAPNTPAELWIYRESQRRSVQVSEAADGLPPSNSLPQLHDTTTASFVDKGEVQVPRGPRSDLVRSARSPSVLPSALMDTPGPCDVSLPEESGKGLTVAEDASVTADAVPKSDGPPAGPTVVAPRPDRDMDVETSVALGKVEPETIPSISEANLAAGTFSARVPQNGPEETSAGNGNHLGISGPGTPALASNGEGVPACALQTYTQDKEGQSLMLNGQGGFGNAQTNTDGG